MYGATDVYFVEKNLHLSTRKISENFAEMHVFTEFYGMCYGRELGCSL